VVAKRASKPADYSLAASATPGFANLRLHPRRHQDEPSRLRSRHSLKPVVTGIQAMRYLGPDVVPAAVLRTLSAPRCGTRSSRGLVEPPAAKPRWTSTARLSHPDRVTSSPRSRICPVWATKKESHACCTDRAVDKGAELAAALDAPLYVIVSYRTVTRSTALALAGGIAAHPGVLARPADRLEGIGLKVTREVWAGDPADALTATAAQVGAQMIVVGTKGMHRAATSRIRPKPRRTSRPEAPAGIGGRAACRHSARPPDSALPAMVAQMLREGSRWKEGEQPGGRRGR
jgi:nucleotide-binding universal stress UspA family protein